MSIYKLGYLNDFHSWSDEILGRLSENRAEGPLYKCVRSKDSLGKVHQTRSNLSESNHNTSYIRYLQTITRRGTLSVIAFFELFVETRDSLQ